MKRVILTKWYDKEQATSDQNDFILKMLKEEDFSFLNLFDGESYYICFDKRLGIKGSKMFKIDITDSIILVDGYTIPSLFLADKTIARRLGAVVQITLAMLDTKEDRVGGCGGYSNQKENDEYSPRRSNEIYIKDYKYVYGKDHISTRAYRKLTEEFSVRGHIRTLKNGLKTFVKGYVKKFDK